MREGGTWGRVAHVFVAIALALPIAAAGGAIGLAATLSGQSLLNRWLLGALGVLFVAVVAWVALLPPVRQVEIATARTLLGMDVPDVAHPGAWDSRRRGAIWLALLVAVGGVVAVGLLYLLPTGVGLVAHPFSGESVVRWPGGPTTTTGSGWHAWWLIPLGLFDLIVAIGLVVAGGWVLASLAPRLLGPTLTERVALAAMRERDLARANALAREVHDRVGHTLTAMTLQVTAARRLIARDPVAADRALAAAEDLGRTAQGDVDAVVGRLRSEAGGSLMAEPLDGGAVDLVAQLRPLVDDVKDVRFDAPPELAVRGEVADAASGILREALTNAQRHGLGPASVRLLPQRGSVVLEISNAADPAAVASGGRRGLEGMRERALLAGGSVGAGPEEGERTWLVRAKLPT